MRDLDTSSEQSPASIDTPVTHPIDAKQLATGSTTEPSIITPTKTLLSRRQFVHGGVLAVSGIALAGCVKGITTRNDIEISNLSLGIDHLPASFNGMTITFASDLHSSPFMSLEDMREIVHMINDLHSDMILLPGDFVTSHWKEIEPMIAALSELKAPMGVFASTGNHEYYVGVDLVTNELEGIGIKVLRNENVKVKKGDDALYLLGVDDGDFDTITSYVEGRHAPHIEAAYAGIPENSATILLCHKPYHFEEYAATKVGLVLSGHTHGGQIVLGRFGKSVMALSSLASHFVEGLYRPTKYQSNSQMYVSRGLGVVGVPLRLNCPPEITKITLRSNGDLQTHKI